MPKTNKLVLLQGEGMNAHTLEANTSFQYKQYNNAIQFLLEGTGVVRHDGPDETDQKHDIIVLEKGNYFSFNQVEYSPFHRDIRAVFD